MREARSADGVPALEKAVVAQSDGHVMRARGEPGL